MTVCLLLDKTIEDVVTLLTMLENGDDTSIRAIVVLSLETRNNVMVSHISNKTYI